MHVACGMCNKHSLFECLGSTEAFMLLQVNIWFLFHSDWGPPNGKKRRTTFTRKFSFENLGNTLSLFSNTRSIYVHFTPYVFVITGTVESTAYLWLLGFWWQQLKKCFVWKKGQGIYSSTIILRVCMGKNIKKINEFMLIRYYVIVSSTVTFSVFW